MNKKFLINLIIILLIMSSNIFSDVICIDPGHGQKSNGDRTGAEGYNGTEYPWEDDINLELAYWFEDRLEWYYDPGDIYVTRLDTFRLDDNLYNDILARLNIAYGYRADAYGRTIFPPLSCDELVSVHCNSNNDTTVRGSSCLVYDSLASSGEPNYPAEGAYIHSFILADEILHSYVGETGSVYSNAGYAHNDPGSVVGVYGFYLTDLSVVPATLFVETEFVSCYDSWVPLTDWWFNNDWSYVAAAGVGIALGCNNYSPIVSSVEPEKPKHKISGFQLQENYPNPFNPTTTIKYNIKKAIIVELGIFNVNGQLIKTLSNDHKSSGSYNVVWDGTNNSGISVASGTYICRLHAS